MSVSQSGGSLLPIGGKSGMAMKLPLHGAGDQNGNAFPVSSSSSSSSSSCLGESSPDSLRSLSSLSGSCLDSPLDVDMPQVTISKWPTEGEGEDGKVENRDASTESVQTVTGRSSESNDNSITSIYLDADSGADYCEDTWNDNDNLTLTTNAVRNNDDLSSSSSIRRRHRSSSPDSDATQVPVMDDDDDDDNDDDEDLFVSVSSDVALRRASAATVSPASNVPILDSLDAPDLCVLSEGGGSKCADLQREGTVPSEEEMAGPGSDQVVCPSELLTDGQLQDRVADDNDNIALRGPLASEVLGETTNTPSSASSVTKKESQLKPPLSQEEVDVALPKSNVLTRAVRYKPSATNSATKTASASSCKPAKPEAKRAPKPDLKNVKAKVASRPAPATAKTTNQNKSTPAMNEKRAVLKKEEVNVADGGKRLRLATGRIKMVAVLKPVRGRVADLRNLKPNQNADAKRAQSEKRGETAIVNGALSGSSSSLGSSDVTVERPSRSPSKAVQEMPVLKGVGEEASAATGDVAKDPVEGSAEEIAQETTRPGHSRRDPQREASVEKPKNRGTKVSSKLGPNARLQGKGARPDNKGATGASCNAGVSHPPSSSGAAASGPPGQGTRIATQTDGFVPGKEAQGAGGEPRAKQSQNQGIPKPRAASGLAAPGCMTSNPKSSSVSQPPAAAGSAGSAGSSSRPAAAAVLSKLPVKGLPTSLSSSSLGSSASEVSGAAVTTKDSTTPGAPAGGPKPEDRPNRSNTIGSGSAVAASAKVPGMRSRALSLQSRSTATGLKAPAVTTSHTASSKPVATNQTAVKTALSTAANQSPTKQQLSHNPLQRSGSVRLSRPTATSSTVWAQPLCVSDLKLPVDKNKPRGAPARPTSTQPASNGGGGANQQQAPPPDLVPDLLSANTVPATPGLPVPASGTATATNAGSGTAPTSGLHVFSRARAGSRTSPKAGSRLQNGLVASGPCSKASVVVGEAGSASVPAGEAPVHAKQNLREQQQADKKNHQGINQLRRLLVQGNRRVEALATVIQHVFTEREEALRQKKQLSQELVNLRDELTTSSQCCERLQKEKEEVRFNLEEAVKKLEEHHKEELAQLEDRLRSFYQTEWDKVHQKYQEEADKCRLLMEQQVEELRSRQEAERTKQEANHSQQIESLKQEHETSIQELKRSQQTELETLDKALKEKEASLSEQISGLLSEKESLSERLRAEEERRRILADKSLKDSHTVYLEQELESLKVVLEIKNTQLHQKDKKLMEMGKLVETNVKLEEHMNKVQQENEDYRARMDKHAALSRQLSSEQAMLQQTLQKESKVNKRLSMENEELMWKLHNGDLLASPRRLSPTSPFHSPRNSASFPTAASMSPR